MTNDEIKIALREKCAVVWRGKTYDYINSWNVTYSERANSFISSVELVERRSGTYTAIMALASEVEINKETEEKNGET